MKILHIVSTLEAHGAARQLSLLCEGLPRDWSDFRVCVLGRETPEANVLRAKNIAVDALDWTRPLPLRAWWRLRRLLRNWRPAIIDCWDTASLRAARIAGARRARLVMGCLPLAAADAHVKHTPGRPGGRRVVCAGQLRPDKGVYDAIWSVDILRFLYPDLQLIVVGDGPDRSRLERFVRGIGVTDRVHFLGRRLDAMDWIAGADVVWVADHADGGVNATLEAMAAGRPIVASHSPSLARIVVPGETGFLVPIGDKAARCRRTRELFDDPTLAQRLGEAGRRRAREQFSIERLVDCYVRMCAEPRAA